MRDTKEIIHRPIEKVELERPFEPHLPTTNGSYGAYRDVGNQEGFQLVHYWRIIRKRFWLVVGIAVLIRFHTEKFCYFYCRLIVAN